MHNKHLFDSIFALAWPVDAICSGPDLEFAANPAACVCWSTSTAFRVNSSHRDSSTCERSRNLPTVFYRSGPFESTIPQVENGVETVIEGVFGRLLETTGERTDYRIRCVAAAGADTGKTFWISCDESERDHTSCDGQSGNTRGAPSRKTGFSQPHFIVSLRKLMV